RRELASAQPVEQRLHLVGELGQVGEAEGGGPALDRMRAAEDRVERLLLGCREVQGEQLLLQPLQVLRGFLEEDLVELAEVEAGAVAAGIGRDAAHPAACASAFARAWSSTVATTCTRRSGANGFTSQPVAPAARPAC